MGGPAILPEQYRKISDWDLIHVYLFAARDDDGNYVPLTRRIQNSEGFLESREKEFQLNGNGQAKAMDPFEALGVPREACFVGVPVQYAVMFFNVLRKQGLKDEKIMEKLKAKVKEVPPWGCHSQV